MALIKLRGKFAVGDFRFAIVDDDLFEQLNQHAWKAKMNGSGSGVYAVRNLVVNKKNITLRMHRVVLGYSGLMDIDHINHNPLDNRRSNLRVVSRSENLLNRRIKTKFVPCRHCFTEFESRYTGTAPSVCNSCKLSRKSVQASVTKISKARVGPSKPKSCGHCASMFVGLQSSAIFCSESCKKKAKWIRQKKIRLNHSAGSAQQNLFTPRQLKQTTLPFKFLGSSQQSMV